MNSVMWIIFIFMLALLVLSLLWLVWRLSHFSRSHDQTVIDDRLMEAMLSDAALSQDVKKRLVISRAGVLAQAEETPAAEAGGLDEMLQADSPQHDGIEATEQNAAASAWTPPDPGNALAAVRTAAVVEPAAEDSKAAPSDQVRAAGGTEGVLAAAAADIAQIDKA